MEEHRADIRQIVGEHHARDARVFGSVARCDDVPGSDVDTGVTDSRDKALGAIDGDRISGHVII
ncbi:hypothetical protein [Kribbia dieselivorans]|uniref:hypothetical protein n=1 Tax=Kribbia dieselivorans TaxID=331526 RepID=UPI0008395681|nr:hypothetical protein [Kribbia dieselivorans]